MERYVGIDLGIATKHKAAVYDELSPVGKPFSVETSHEGLEYLLKRATDGAEGPVHFVLEPTSNIWLPIAAYLNAAGHRVYLMKTQKSSDFRKFFSKHAKSDSIDAGVLARIPQIDPKGVHELFIPTAKETTLKRLVKRRERYVGDARHGSMEWCILPVISSRLATDFRREKTNRAGATGRFST